ncbi:MAG TPA: hypothetical protein V6C81_12175 [Planktothrix sp.]|jgi:hypothetical protein
MFFLNKRARDAPARVTADDFNGTRVQRAVLMDCLQHPATIFPAALALGTLFFGFFALNPVTVGIALALGCVAGIAFVFNYVINGEKRAVARVNMLRERQKEQMVDDVEEVIQNCKQEGMLEWAAKARELRDAYAHLVAYFNDHQQRKSLLMFQTLAEDTFKQGLANLTLALNLNKAIKLIDKKKMTEELEVWKYQAARMDAKSGAILRQSIDDHEKALKLLDDKQALLVEAFAKANQIELALQATHLELVQRGDEDPTEFLNKDGGAVHQLNETLEAARKVEARLRGSDTEQAEKEDRYARMADKRG